MQRAAAAQRAVGADEDGRCRHAQRAALAAELASSTKSGLLSSCSDCSCANWSSSRPCGSARKKRDGASQTRARGHARHARGAHAATPAPPDRLARERVRTAQPATARGEPAWRRRGVAAGDPRKGRHSGKCARKRRRTAPSARSCTSLARSVSCFTSGDGHSDGESARSVIAAVCCEGSRCAGDSRAAADGRAATAVPRR